MKRIPFAQGDYFQLAVAWVVCPRFVVLAVSVVMILLVAILLVILVVVLAFYYSLITPGLMSLSLVNLGEAVERLMGEVEEIHLNMKTLKTMRTLTRVCEQANASEKKQTCLFLCLDQKFLIHEKIHFGP